MIKYIFNYFQYSNGFDIIYLQDQIHKYFISSSGNRSHTVIVTTFHFEVVAVVRETKQVKVGKIVEKRHTTQNKTLYESDQLAWFK